MNQTASHVPVHLVRVTAPRSRVSSRVPLARVLFMTSPKRRACSQASKIGANQVWNVLRPAPCEIRRRTFLRVYVNYYIILVIKKRKKLIFSSSVVSIRLSPLFLVNLHNNTVSNLGWLVQDIFPTSINWDAIHLYSRDEWFLLLMMPLPSLQLFASRVTFFGGFSDFKLRG